MCLFVIYMFEMLTNVFRTTGPSYNTTKIFGKKSSDERNNDHIDDLELKSEYHLLICLSNYGDESFTCKSHDTVLLHVGNIFDILSITCMSKRNGDLNYSEHGTEY